MKLACHALACGALALLALRPAAGAEPELEIRKFELAYDAFGPVRKDVSYFPGERLCCRYDVHGCGMNDAGQAELEITIQLTDAKGKVRSAFSNTVKTQSWKNSQGFARVRSFHAFADDYRPGRYRFELAIEDKLTQREAKVAQDVTIKPVALAIVSPKFYYDARHELAAPLAGLIDQTIYASFEIVGEDRSQGKAAIAHSFQLIDDKGDNVLRDAPPQEAQLDDPNFLRDRSRHPLIKLSLPLRQAGKYTMRLTVVDQMTGATTQLELPLEVLDRSEPGVFAAN